MKCEECKYFEKPHFHTIYNANEFTEMRVAGLSHEDIQKKCDKEYEVGECWRFPATVKLKNYGYGHIEVFRDDKCGEFEPKGQK